MSEQVSGLRLAKIGSDRESFKEDFNLKRLDLSPISRLSKEPVK